MALNQQRQEDSDYLADKIGKLLKEPRPVNKLEVGNFILQVAQIVIVGIIGVLLKYHTDTQDAAFKQEQLQADASIKERQLKNDQMKLVLEFLDPLTSKDNPLKTQIAIWAFEKYQGYDFALGIGLALNDTALNMKSKGIQEALDQLQKGTSSDPVPVSPPPSSPTPSAATAPPTPAAGPSTSRSVTPPSPAPQPSQPSSTDITSGWVYLGAYDTQTSPPWSTQYFNIPDTADPSKLVGTTIHVISPTSASNLRSELPGQKPKNTTQLCRVFFQDQLIVKKVQALSTFQWAQVDFKPGTKCKVDPVDKLAGQP
jgi:hypothetical protein